MAKLDGDEFNFGELPAVGGPESSEELEDAVALYARALAIREKTLGRDHPGVATRLNNLAAMFVILRRYAEAEPMFQRALAIYEKALGPEHPGVAGCLNNMARLRRAQGRPADAEPLLKRALKIFERVHGPDHPNMGSTLGSLADVLGPVRLSV